MYIPQLPLLHDACIDKVIEIVKSSQDLIVLELNNEIAQLQNTNSMSAGTIQDICDKFNHTCAWISCGYMARLLLNAISTYQVCKNWNSHGAT